MEKSVVFVLLVLLTVTVSSQPLDSTTPNPDDPNSIFFTVPATVSQAAPIRNKSDESRLEITLKLDESDKEVIDNDMGKYPESRAGGTAIICRKAVFSCVGGACK